MTSRSSSLSKGSKGDLPILNYFSDETVQEWLLNSKPITHVPSLSLLRSFASFDKLYPETSLATEHEPYTKAQQRLFLPYACSRRYLFGIIYSPSGEPPFPNMPLKPSSSLFVADCAKDKILNFIWYPDGKVVAVTIQMTLYGDCTREFILFDAPEPGKYPSKVLAKSVLITKRDCLFCHARAKICKCGEGMRIRALKPLKPHSVELGWEQWIDRFKVLRMGAYSAKVVMTQFQEDGIGVTSQIVFEKGFRFSSCHTEETTFQNLRFSALSSVIKLNPHLEYFFSLPHNEHTVPDDASEVSVYSSKGRNKKRNISCISGDNSLIDSPNNYRDRSKMRLKKPHDATKEILLDLRGKNQSYVTYSGEDTLSISFEGGDISATGGDEDVC